MDGRTACLLTSPARSEGRAAPAPNSKQLFPVTSISLESSIISPSTMEAFQSRCPLESAGGVDIAS